MNTIEKRAVRQSPRTWVFAFVALSTLGASTADVSAQEREGTLGIERLVRSALDANRDLNAARQVHINAQERVSEAWSTVMPTVDLNASYTRNIAQPVTFMPAQIFDPGAGPNDYISVRFGADNVYASTIGIEQPLFRPGVFVALGAAGRYERLQEEVVRGATQTIATQVRVSYYQLLLAQEQVRLTARSVERVRESLVETRALNRAGLATDYDVLRLEVELANLEPNLRRAENAVRQARRQVAILVNLPDAETLRVAGNLAEVDLEDPAANGAENREILSFVGFAWTADAGVDAALAEASRSRSDLRQLDLMGDLRRAEMRLEQAGYLPDITLFGSYVINAQNNGGPNWFGGSTGQRASSRFVGLRVSVPIFDGFRRDARIDQARATLRETRWQAEQGQDLARSQVRTVAEEAEEAFLRARGQRLAVRQAGRGYEIATAQHREGISSQLELTDAEVALRQSEFNYAQAVFDYLVARARLDEAVGRVPLVDVEPIRGGGF